LNPTRDATTDRHKATEVEQASWFESDVTKLDQDTQAALSGLLAAADELAGIRMHTGRQRPSVVT